MKSCTGAILLVAGLLASTPSVNAKNAPLKFPLRETWAHFAAKPMPAFDESHVPLSTGGTSVFLPTSPYDWSYAMTAADGSVCYASTSEGAVVCLDVTTGARQWAFYTGGAVRFAPTYAHGKLWFGSDDGFAYCISAKNGSLIWKFQAAPGPRIIIGAGRFMSQWPVRTGVEVRDGLAYFACGLVSNLDAFLFCVEADSGKLKWREPVGLTPEGRICTTKETLYIPTGVTAPIDHRLADGKPLFAGNLEYRRCPGSARVTALDDGLMWFGPDEFGVVKVLAAQTKDERAGANLPVGVFLTLSASALYEQDGLVYVVTPQKNATHKIVAIPLDTFQSILTDKASSGRSSVGGSGKGFANLEAGITSATKATPRPSAVLMDSLFQASTWKADAAQGWQVLAASDNALLAAGKELIVAYDIKTGAKLWEQKVPGTIWNLAVSDSGQLLASTDAGTIHCFSAGVSAPAVAPLSNPFVSDPKAGNFEKLAKDAITLSGRNKGFALLLGIGEGNLAYALAQQSELYILGLDTDSGRIERVREKLRQAGVFGHRVHLAVAPDGNTSGYMNYFANLILSEEGGEKFSVHEIVRLLHPYGGTLYLNGKLPVPTVANGLEKVEGVPAFKRGALEGAGQWVKHQANLYNNANSGDALVKGLSFDVQWYGPPGTKDTVNRHMAPSSPVSADGLVFHFGLQYIHALDIYNGTYLWKKPCPTGNKRHGSHDPGPATVDGRYLYMTLGPNCEFWDVVTGEKKTELSTPVSGLSWGYVALRDDLLFGSAQHPEASQRGLNEQDSKGIMLYQYRPATLDSKSKADANNNSNPTCADALFAYDLNGNRSLQWKRASGKILNSSICFGKKYLYFLEGRGPSLTVNPWGRINLQEFFQTADGRANPDTYLVAVDPATGKLAWETHLADMEKTRHLFVLSYDPSRDILFFTNSWFEKDYDIYYGMRRLDPVSGKEMWRVQFPKGKKAHAFGFLGNETGHQHAWTYPAIVNGRALLNFQGRKNASVNLTDGKVEYPPFESGRCAPYAASLSNIFFRGGWTSTVDLSTNERGIISRNNRPSCWISTLPVGGLVVAPEGQSVQCSCGMSLRTSMAFAPNLSRHDIEKNAQN